MFEEIDLQIGDEASTQPQIIRSWGVPCSGVTASGGYGTSCHYCC